MLGAKFLEDIFGGNRFPPKRLVAGLVYRRARFTDFFFIHLAGVIVQVERQRLLD